MCNDISRCKRISTFAQNNTTFKEDTWLNQSFDDTVKLLKDFCNSKPIEGGLAFPCYDVTYTDPKLT